MVHKNQGKTIEDQYLTISASCVTDLNTKWIRL